MNSLVKFLLGLPPKLQTAIWLALICVQIAIGVISHQEILVYSVSIIGWFGAIFYIGAWQVVDPK